jgi:cytochrome c oxidase assembly protein subunit 15
VKTFRRFALLTTLAVYALIFIGGLVRVSGAGLGCPDWPRCFGRWIPPTSISQLPPEIDPSQFNFTLAWIEYGNRLVGVSIGILILITAILAVKYYRKVPRILFPSLAALLLVVYQGWQGGQVVESSLKPILVSIHMVAALVIASILIYVTQQSYYLENPETEKDAVYPQRTHLWISLLWVVGIVQVILGTQVREGLEMLRERFPLLPASEFRNHIGSINYVHAVLGIVIAVATLTVGSVILRKSRRLSGLVRESIWGVMLLVTAQLAIGLVLVLAGLPSLMQLFHLWIAGLYIGALFVLYSAFKRGQIGREDPALTRGSHAKGA